MVAPIAPEPAGMSTAVADYRLQRGADVARAVPLQDDPLPPVPTPVPTPVPAPAIQPPSEAFAAALAISAQPPIRPGAIEVLRRASQWSPPASDLTLTDRLV